MSGKGFKYRLEPLIDVKEEEKKEAGRALVEMQRRLSEAINHLEELERIRMELLEEKAQQRKALLEPSDGEALKGKEILDRQDRLRALGGEIESNAHLRVAQREIVKECETNVNKARQSLSSVSQELEVLKKHKAKLRQEFVQEEDRKLQLEQDELGNMIFIKNKGARQ